MMEKSKFTDAQIAFVLARRRRALRLMVRRAVDMAKARGRVPSGLVCSLVRLKWMRGRAANFVSGQKPVPARTAALASPSSTSLCTSAAAAARCGRGI